MNERLALWSVVANLLLFGAKLWIGVRSGSIAVLSDAYNSALDVSAYTVMLFAVKVHQREPDDDHPFGHRRAEPLASLFVALLAGILGASIIRDTSIGLLMGSVAHHEPWAPIVLLSAIGLKLLLAGLFHYRWAATGSRAMLAGYIDSRNDVLVTFLALSGYMFGGIADDMAGLALGIWILFSGWSIGIQNIGFLMGRAPHDNVLQRILLAVQAVPGVLSTHVLRAHYVGDRLHVEVHVMVDKRMSLLEGHDLEHEIKHRVEQLDFVEICYVHIDPIGAH